MKYAYVTVLSTNNYYKGVLVLFESLKRTNPKYNEYVVLVNETIGEDIKNDLISRGYKVVTKNKINAPHITNEKYSHWSNSFDKFNIFDLTEYDKVVYLDSDMYVCSNIDELFDMKNMSATIAGKTYYDDWTNLNSGLMVVEPKEGVLEDLKDLLKNWKSTSHVGDQDIIGYYYDWENKDLIISEKYNMFSYLIENYIKDSLFTNEDFKVIHYIGSKKPWMLNKEEIKEYKEKIKDNKNELYFFEKYLDILKEFN